METITKARFITDFYGGAPALGAQGVLEKYIEGQIDKSLISFLDSIKKKGETIQDKASEILSIFHRDDDGNPIIGNWMLHKCLVKTGQAIFNAMKDRTHPKREIILNAIISVEPIPSINVFNGGKITKPAGVRTYTVTVGKRSFFKAYEWIQKGTTFKFITTFDDSLLSEGHMNSILQKAGRFGVGAFRERFGKFEIVN
jgi:hypothetical protein